MQGGLFLPLNFHSHSIEILIQIAPQFLAACYAPGFKGTKTCYYNTSMYYLYFYTLTLLLAKITSMWPGI